LGWANPPKCTTNGTPYAYGPNSIIARLRTTGWYIGNNSRGGRSLYQTTGQGITNSNQEITEGVQDMQIQYLVPGATDYVEEAAITNWGQVSAVRIVLTLQGSENLNVDGTPITREVAHVVTLRNRNS
jgi:type IV pilus assembly protein PilW